jgi:ABC-type sugar transport system ATPase subunit
MISGYSPSASEIDPLNTPMITAQAVRKLFSGITVLENIDLEVRAGEVHTLMGENGAGKSTLMKILGGVLQPDAGPPVTFMIDNIDQFHF